MSSTRLMVTISLLMALATVLMLFEIPNPFVPFLKFDLSDAIVLVALAAFGVKVGFTVSILRLVLFGLIQGNIDGSIFPYVGLVGAFFATTSLMGGYLLATKVLSLNKVMSSVVMILMVTSVMTVLNYFLITPLYFGWPNVSFTDIQVAFTGFLNFDTGGTFSSNSYLLANLFAYVPFNVFKGVFISSLFFVLEPRVQNFIQR
jgi:riboflavin transporter FmnP